MTQPHTLKHTMICALLALCFLPSLTLAESATGAMHQAPPAAKAAAKEAWKNMTPEQRQAKRAEAKAQRQQNWAALSPEEKAAKKAEMNTKWRQKWQQMTPEQQAAHKAKAKERWNAMPAEKQEKIKERMVERRYNKKMKTTE